MKGCQQGRNVYKVKTKSKIIDCELSTPTRKRTSDGGSLLAKRRRQIVCTLKAVLLSR